MGTACRYCPGQARDEMTEPVGPTPSRSTTGKKSSIDRVIDALQAQGLAPRNVRGDSVKALCPAHDEQTPSFSVTWRAGPTGGTTLLYCFGCQAGSADLAAAMDLSLADLYDVPLPEAARVGKSSQQRAAGARRGQRGRLPKRIIFRERKVEHAHRWVEVRRYPYTNVAGELVQEVIRQECATGEVTHKTFRQRYPVGDGRFVEHEHEVEGFVPVLYRAPWVRAAVADRVAVWLVEGEKDAETAEALGVVATTNARGARTLPDELVKEFVGADVVAVLDRDLAGWARGVMLYEKLDSVCASLRLRIPALARDKADLTDHVEAGYELDALVEVSVQEVAAWDGLNGVDPKDKLLRSAVAESRAHLNLVQEGTDTEKHQDHARRWAVETQVRHEALQREVDEVYQLAERAGTPWAREAAAKAGEISRAGADAAKRCHMDLDLPVPQSLRPPREAGSGTTGEEHARVSSPRKREAKTPFRILDGQIVQWVARSGNSSKPDAEDSDPSFKPLLSTVVTLTAREYLEVEDDHDVEAVPLMGRASHGKRKAAAPQTLIAVRLEYPDEVTGELMEIRVMADQWRDHSWLASLPGGPDYDHRRAGMDVLQRAILAVSPDCVDEELYRATGWRMRSDGSHRFIHARGAITATGHEDSEVALSGALARYDLPDPSTDRDVLAEAFWEQCVTMLDRMPDHVAAPLLGHTYRAALGHNAWVLTLVGPPGSYKTSLAAKTMHHFGERWDHKKPASSMSGNGDTFNALRYKLHNAKDTLYWADDFAPTKSWTEAQKHLEESARLIHNAEERGRSSRDGLSISAGTGPRASGLFTSEVMPRPGSASERMLVVPLSRDDIDTSTLFPLDEPHSRYARALIMASYISWLAGDLTGRRQQALDAADVYAAKLIETGETVRAAASIAQTWAGWFAMTEYLHSTGVITAQRREELLARVDVALRAAGRAAVDPDLPRTTGARVRELLQYALRQGIAYVDDVRTGECPPWPLAGRLGWRRTIGETDTMGHSSKIRNERMGLRLGYVLHDPDLRERGRVLMCDSTQLEAALKAASGTQTEQLQIDRLTAQRALYDEGVLIPDLSEQGRVRLTTKCRIHVEQRTGRMVTLHLDEILGEDLDNEPPAWPDEPDPTDGGPGESDHPNESDPGGADGGTEKDGSEPDPQVLDIDGVSEDGGSITEDHGGSEDRPDQPAAQEDPMRDEEFTSRVYTDLDGVMGWTQPPGPDTYPCAVCGVRCGIVIDGTRVHPPCWERTRGTDRVPAPQQPAAARPDAKPAPAAPTTSAPRSASSPVCAAVIVDVDGIWGSNGQHTPLPWVPKHVGELFDLAHGLGLGTAVTKYRTAAGQVWLGTELAHQMGIDVEAISSAAASDQDATARRVTKDSPAVTAALEAGYSLGGRDNDSIGRWTRIWKGSERALWLVLLPAMTKAAVDTPLMVDDPDHPTLARRIGRLADELGHPFQLSAPTTGLDLLKALRWKDRDRFFQVREHVPPALMNLEAELLWSRKPTSEELEHTWVHAYDRSGSYAAGASGLELGLGQATHHPDGCAFTKRVPGYWRVEIPTSGDWRAPNPLDPTGRTSGHPRWVTTPGLEFAYEQGYEPEVLEAWTWNDRARVLDPWYERIRDARTALDVDDADSQVAREQLKAIYSHTVGMLGSHTFMAGKDMYAPDWRHHVVAKARTNVLRRIATIGKATGRWPVAAATDTVLYTSNEPDPQKAWPGGENTWGRQLGRYKYEGSAKLTDHLQYLTASRYKGKDHLSKQVDE